MNNQRNLENLSFEVVIPSALLLNPKIDHACLRLYCFVKGLTRAHGYCFATNHYLAELMGASEASIKRWLGQLKGEGLLEIKTNKNAVHWQRHIYVATDLKKCLRRLMDEHPPAQPCATPSSPVSTIIEDIEKEDRKRKITTQAKPAESPSSKQIKNTPSPLAFELTARLVDSILVIKPDFKALYRDNWAKSIDQMIQIDKRSAETILNVIKWLPSSEFWSRNILSGAKLREKFDRLELEMQAKEKKTPEMAQKEGRAALATKGRDYANEFFKSNPKWIESGSVKLHETCVEFVS